LPVYRTVCILKLDRSHTAWQSLPPDEGGQINSHLLLTGACHLVGPIHTSLGIHARCTPSVALLAAPRSPTDTFPPAAALHAVRELGWHLSSIQPSSLQVRPVMNSACYELCGRPCHLPHIGVIAEKAWWTDSSTSMRTVDSSTVGTASPRNSLVDIQLLFGD
jgi:hypothetical protein